MIWRYRRAALAALAAFLLFGAAALEEARTRDRESACAPSVGWFCFVSAVGSDATATLLGLAGLGAACGAVVLLALAGFGARRPPPGSRGGGPSPPPDREPRNP
ncbi:MAG: hypothetical protein ACYDCK_01675 [Thermoplasmatota archaeon]